MVDITILKDGFKAEGHALFDKTGKDIVCAGISAILTGALNLIGKEHKNAYFGLENGYCRLKFHGEENTIFKNLNMYPLFITQLRTIEQAYPKHIQITVIE